jgi:G3E family GTPase
LRQTELVGAYREPEFLPWDGRRVPLTFVGGYLGAGKTTVINEVLAQATRPIAVIVNDVGAVNIDARLIRRRRGDTIELVDGCVCCSSIDGMGAAFDQIRGRPEPPDHVLVELSGLADPRRMVLWGNSAGFVLDGVVVVTAADQLVSRTLPEWLGAQLDDQLSQADLIVLTKTDLVSADLVAAATLRLSQLAPGVPVVVRSVEAAPTGAIGRLLALGGRHPGGVTDLPQATLFDAHDVASVVVPPSLSEASLRDWIDIVIRSSTARIVRAKGVIETVDAGLVLVQVVGPRCEITPVPAPERQTPTDLVVITLRERGS